MPKQLKRPLTQLQIEQRRKAATVHGGSKTRLHNIWKGMRQRCQYEGHTKYWNYGGRGIKVCEDWQTFPAFRYWALANGYEETLTLDRIDCDGNYAPDNCRWVSYKLQNLNRRMWGERIPHPSEGGLTTQPEASRVDP